MSDNLQSGAAVRDARMDGLISWPECPKGIRTPPLVIQEKGGAVGGLLALKSRLLSEQQIRGIINVKFGADDSIQVLITRKLYKSDVDKQQNRLSIGRHPDVPEFLRDNEKQRLMRDWDLNMPRQEIPEMWVTLIEPFGELSKITLKIWKSGEKRNPTYVLTTKWRDVVDRNALAEDETLRVLSFRDGDDQLGIALVKNPLGGN